MANNQNKPELDGRMSRDVESVIPKKRWVPCPCPGLKIVDERQLIVSSSFPDKMSWNGMAGGTRTPNSMSRMAWFVFKEISKLNHLSSFSLSLELFYCDLLLFWICIVNRFATCEIDDNLSSEYLWGFLFLGEVL